MADREEYRQSIGRVLSHLTIQTAYDAEVDETLSALTTAAVTLIRGADYADVMVTEHGRFRSVAPTATLIADLDAVQVQCGQGPCLDAAADDAIIRSSDLSTEDRWPLFTPAALAAGVNSVLSFQLYTHRYGAGALNIFGRAAGSFTLGDEAIGALLATHAAIVIIKDAKSMDYDSTMADSDRDVIGQAKGILMERFRIDAARAVRIMVTYAHSSKTPLPSVAREITTSAVR